MQSWDLENHNGTLQGNSYRYMTRVGKKGSNSRAVSHNMGEHDFLEISLSSVTLGWLQSVNHYKLAVFLETTVFLETINRS